jgi:hypothetical protein
MIRGWPATFLGVADAMGHHAALISWLVIAGQRII